MTIKTSVIKVVDSFLLKRRLRLARTTDYAHLEQFFKAIKPVTTNHELIRIGGVADGGYLVPNDLQNIEICFSPGVSVISNFEDDLAGRGIECFLADYSVEGSLIQNKKFHFEKKFLGTVEDSKYMTLENWVQRNAPDRSDFILQMDIEGSEYGVICDTRAETLKKFRILVIEFHSLQALCDRLGFQFIDLTFKKLLKDFEIVHIHPNNCFKPVVYGKYQIPPTLEITFLRKDRIKSKVPTSKFPHKLDLKNDPTNEDLALPSCWF